MQMEFEEMNLVTLPEVDGLQAATRLFPEPTLIEDGGIVVKEMMINNELSPDIALIEAFTNTPVQRYEGEGEVTEIFYSTCDNGSIGVLLMSPEGEITARVYDPKKQGGPRGYSIKKGWTMQTIIPEGTVLKFFEYWSPKGFASREGDQMYGEVVLKTVDDEPVLEKFKTAEKQLLDYLKQIGK